MNPAYTYLAVDLFCILVPFLASFHPRIAFYKQWKFFTLPCLLTALSFLVWDYYFTKIGVWQFNPHFITGAYLLNLPIEEILFFICIPYSCVFTYYVFRTYIKPVRNGRPFSQLALLLAIVSVTLAIFFHNKLYSSATFTFLAIGLMTAYTRKVSWLPVFFISYTVLLIPFMISNGILTGSFIDAPVVIYNNTQNLGIRIATIPVEDVFYGMLLFLMNVSGFELLKARHASKLYFLK